MSDIELRELERRVAVTPDDGPANELLDRALARAGRTTLRQSLFARLVSALVRYQRTLPRAVFVNGVYYPAAARDDGYFNAYLRPERPDAPEIVFAAFDLDETDVVIVEWHDGYRAHPDYAATPGDLPRLVNAPPVNAVYPFGGAPGGDGEPG